MSAGSEESSWSSDHDNEEDGIPVTMKEIREEYESAMKKGQAELSAARTDAERVEVLRQLFMASTIYAYVLEHRDQAVQMHYRNKHTREMGISDAPQYRNIRRLRVLSMERWNSDHKK